MSNTQREDGSLQGRKIVSDLHVLRSVGDFCGFLGMAVYLHGVSGWGIVLESQVLVPPPGGSALVWRHLVNRNRKMCLPN